MQGRTPVGPTSAADGAPSPAPVTVTVRYWAGARAAAGVATDLLPYAGEVTVADVLADAARLHPDLGPVLEVASVLLDGTRAEPGRLLGAGAVVEVLPPFAGG